MSKFKQLTKEIELNQVLRLYSYDQTIAFGTMYQETLLQERIQFKPPPPYKHSLNVVIEKAMGKINAAIRSLLYQAKLHHLI